MIICGYYLSDIDITFFLCFVLYGNTDVQVSYVKTVALMAPG